MPDQFDALFQGNHETGHTLVGDRQHALVLDRHEERNHRAARTHDVAIADYRKTSVMTACVGVAGYEQFVRRKLGRPVQVDRAAGLVGRQRDYTFDAFVDAHID
ncbi:hypothetical protein D3C84_1091740 [compost metagenome]